MKNNERVGHLFYKVVAAILLSTMVASPLTIAFADEITPTPVSSSAETPDTSSSAPSLDQSQTGSPDAITVDQSQATPLAKNSDIASSSDIDTTTGSKTTTQKLSMGTSLPGQPSDEPQSPISPLGKELPLVNNSGALQYSYPIKVPPGRNNLTPQLSIDYNSQNTFSDSIIGYGWNLSIPYIARESKHGVDQLYAGTYNDFTTSDNGELGQISGNTYQLRADDGSYTKYVYSSMTGWTVTTKSGMTYTYGTLSGTRQDDPSDSTHIYKWMLDKIADTNGNFITYTYFKDQGQIYPDTITYTNTSGGSGPFSITFGRQSAPSVISAGYSSGFDIKTNYRINTITVSISGATRHSYALAYTNSDNGARSLLSGITETGYDVSAGSKTFPEEKFTYSTSNGKNFTSAPSYTMPTHTLSGGTRQDARLGDSGDNNYIFPNAKTGTLIDINGDGYSDWIETENAAYQSSGSSNGVFYDVWLGSATGWTISSAWTSALPLDSNGHQYQLSDFQNNRLVDINGDGLPDWVITTPGSTVNSDTDVVWLNTGSGWTKNTSWAMPTIVVSGTTYGIAAGPSTPAVNGYGVILAPSGYNYYGNLIDVNNDGLPDIVVTTNDNFGASTTSDHYGVWLNTGSGWTRSTSWAMPIHPSGSTYYGSLVTGYSVDTILDVNGDGLPDWVETTYNPSSNETYDVWINSGTGWVRNTAWVMPVHTASMPANTFTSQGIPLGFSYIVCNYGIGGSYNCATRSNTMMDVNGDGLPDFVETVDSSTFLEFHDVWLNTGKGWTKNGTWGMPLYRNTYGYSPNIPIRIGNTGTFSTGIADINNDGLPDFVASCDCATTSGSANPQIPIVFINTGSSWQNVDSWQQPTRSGSGNYNGSLLGFTAYSSPTQPMMFRTTVLQDINGDSSPDWIESNQFQTPPTYALGTNAYERYQVWTNSSTQSDLLKSITYDHGASSTFTYAPQTVVDKNAAGQTQTIEAVTSVVLNDGNGGAATTSYSYANGKYFYATDKTWRRFAGFQKITTTRPDSSKEIAYYHQGNTIDSGSYENTDDEYQIGKLYRTDTTDASGNLYKRTTTTWGTTPITSVNSNVGFVHKIQTIIEDFDGNGTERATAETFGYLGSNGNLVTDTNYGEVTATSPITYTDIGTDKAVTTYSYASNTGGMYLPSDVTTVDQSSVKVSETQHLYDNLALGSVTLGNETKTLRWKTSTTYIATHKMYNTNGTVSGASDGRGNITSYTYDTNNLYPATVTDPMTHTTQYVYDYMFGVPIQTTDQNSNIYYTDYDGMGRKLDDKIPDPTGGPALYRDSFSYDDEATGISGVEDTVRTYTGISYYIENYYDGLGRLLETKRQIDPNNNPNNYQTIDSWYDPSGRLSDQSLPYINGSGSYSKGSGASSLNTNYLYDVEGRLLTTTNTLGTTTNVYDQWKTTTTDPNSNVKGYYHDAYGNLSRVDEINSGTTYSTYYTWDLNKSLTKITDALGNVRNFTYDGLGRRLTAEDLHASTDTTFGSWSYTYDDANNLTQSISPNNATVNYTYDNAERTLTEDYTGATGTEVTYTYDTCTQGIGKLCTVTMGSISSTAYAYNFDGWIASENDTIVSSSYNTYYTYNRGGDIVTITYPDNAAVQYTYLSDGLVGSVDRKESGGSYTPVVSAISYSPDLKIATMTYANGVVTTNTYDPAKLYRLTNKQSQNASAVNLQNIAYTYDTNGNLTNLVDSSVTDASKTVAYTYDNLNRVKTATATGVHSGTSTYAETYSYDALGNITAKNGQTYLYQGNTGTLKANPDAATSINAVTYTYDADGNLTGNGTLTNTWDYKDQLTKTVIGGVVTHYYYDQVGTRVRSSTTGGATTNYPNKYYSIGTTPKTKQIYLGDMLVATVQTASAIVTPFYIQTDPILGSNVISDATGAKNQLLDYYPFGDLRLNEKATSFDEKNKFGGHQYDADTDLNYLGARYYDGKTGHFISQDPTSRTNPEQFLSDPQQLNFYSYARDNPLTNVDPDGRSVIGNVWNNLTAGPTERYQAVRQSIAQGSWQPLRQSFTNQFQQMFPQPGDSQQVVNAKNLNLVLSFTGGSEGGFVQETKLLNPAIANIESQIEEHIIPRHTDSGIVEYAGKSKFDSGVDIKGLIQKTTQSEMTPSRGNFIRTLDTGSKIGTIGKGFADEGSRTSIITVVTDKLNNLISAYPGKPRK